MKLASNVALAADEHHFHFECWSQPMIRNAPTPLVLHCSKRQSTMTHAAKEENTWTVIGAAAATLLQEILKMTSQSIANMHDNQQYFLTSYKWNRWKSFSYKWKKVLKAKKGEGENRDPRGSLLSPSPLTPSMVTSYEGLPGYDNVLKAKKGEGTEEHLNVYMTRRRTFPCPLSLKALSFAAHLLHLHSEDSNKASACHHKVVMLMLRSAWWLQAKKGEKERDPPLWADLSHSLP